jgi:hypothetical protein
MASATYLWWAAAVALMTVRYCHRQHCQGGKNGMVEQFVLFENLQPRQLNVEAR